MLFQVDFIARGGNIGELIFHADHIGHNMLFKANRIGVNHCNHIEQIRNRC